MSRKRKRNFPQQASTPIPTPEAFDRQITFDSMEDKIRGEEMLNQEEHKRIKEAREIKKKLEASEVERRLEELRKQLKLKK
jgi:hypothetical protein